MSDKSLSPLIELYRLVLLVLVIYFLLIQNALTALLNLPTYLDEGIQAIFLGCIFVNALHNHNARIFLKSYLVLFLFFIAISFEALGHRGLSNVLQQVFIHLKFVVFFAFVALFVPPKLARQLLLSFFVVTILFMLVNFIVPVSFTSLMQQELSERYGLPRPVGIQAQTGNLGFTLGLFCLYWVCRNPLLAEVKKYGRMAGFGILILLSTVRSALVVFPLILLWRLKTSFQSFAVVSLLSLALIGVLGSSAIVKQMIQVTEDNIAMMVDDPSESAYIRGMMIFFSIQLATDRFPFGTGASSFGTVTSDNSAIYTEIGMQNSRFFIEKEGIYDSNFASLLGEFGVLGLITYYLSFFLFFRFVLQRQNLEISNEFKWIAFSFFFIYSVTGPVFMNTYQIFLFVLLVVAAANRPDSREGDLREQDD